jgi:hypothetical protein
MSTNKIDADKLAEEIKSLSVVDVQLIALKTVVETLEKRIASHKSNIEYYETEAEGKLKDLNRSIGENAKALSYDEYLLQMLTTTKGKDICTRLSLYPVKTKQLMAEVDKLKEEA